VNRETKINGIKKGQRSKALRRRFIYIIHSADVSTTPILHSEIRVSLLNALCRADNGMPEFEVLLSFTDKRCTCGRKSLEVIAV